MGACNTTNSANALKTPNVDWLLIGAIVSGAAPWQERM